MAVHLFAHDGDDLVDGALTEREVAVDSGSELANVAAAQEEFMAGDFGVGGSFTQGGDEELRPAVDDVAFEGLLHVLGETFHRLEGRKQSCLSILLLAGDEAYERDESRWENKASCWVWFMLARKSTSPCSICRLDDRHRAKRRVSVISRSPSYAAARYERSREVEVTTRIRGR